MNDRDMRDVVASKVPAVTLVFWIIKIAATTLGETGGDTVTMTLNWGYLAGTALPRRPAGPCRIADRSQEISSLALLGGSSLRRRHDDGRFCRPVRLGHRLMPAARLLFLCLIAVLALLVLDAGIDCGRNREHPQVEAFYWAAITFSQTLGTDSGIGWPRARGLQGRRFSPL